MINDGLYYLGWNWGKIWVRVYRNIWRKSYRWWWWNVRSDIISEGAAHSIVWINSLIIPNAGVRIDGYARTIRWSISSSTNNLVVVSFISLKHISFQIVWVDDTRYLVNRIVTRTLIHLNWQYCINKKYFLLNHIYHNLW